MAEYIPAKDEDPAIAQTRSRSANGMAAPRMSAVVRLRDQAAGLANVARRALTVSLLGLVLGGLASLAATGFVAAVEWLA